MYWVYVAYGFSSLAMYNTLLSTIDFFIKQMPDHNPSFFLGLGFNLLVGFTAVFVMVYGHYLAFTFKNNISILIQIPFSIALPLSSNFLKNANSRFIAFIFIMMALGAVNSL